MGKAGTDRVESCLGGAVYAEGWRRCLGYGTEGLMGTSARSMDRLAQHGDHARTQLGVCELCQVMNSSRRVVCQGRRRSSGKWHPGGRPRMMHAGVLDGVARAPSAAYPIAGP